MSADAASAIDQAQMPNLVSSPSMSLPIASNTDASIPPSMPASLQAAAAGLNEEDAKLLASLAEGNGLLSHLSNLAAQNASSDQLINAYDGLMLDPSSAALASVDPAFDAAQQAFQSAVDLNEALTHQDMNWDDEAFDDLEPEDEDQDQGPIQAYAKLEFPGFSYYIQTLDVTIGRRPGQLQPNQPAGAQPPQLPNAASGLLQAHITSESKTEGDVDVDLGPLKSISRLHARIFYYTGPIHPPNSVFLNGTPTHSRVSSGNGAAPYRITSPTALNRVNGSHLSDVDATAQDPYSLASHSGVGPGIDPDQGEGQFVLMVVGRNGAFVDDVWVERGGIVVLGKRTKIQIAERVFYFVLPPPPGEAAYSVDGDSQRAHHSESDSLSDLSSEGQAEDDDNDQEDHDDKQNAGEEPHSSASSVSSDQDGDDAYDDNELVSYDATQAASATIAGRRRSSVAAGRGKLDPPKRRLVLKPKSKVGKAVTAHESAFDESMEVFQDEAKGRAQSKAKISAKTTAAALANRAAGKGKGKGKGKGAGRGKMPTKGPLPQTRPDGEDSDSLGTPSVGEQSSDGEQTIPRPPSNAHAGVSGKHPAKGAKGQKSTKSAKAGKAKIAKETAQPSGSEGADTTAVKKGSPTPTWALGAGIAGRKRKRGEPVTNEEPTLKVGTPIGIEALDAAKRAKAAKARADATSRPASTSPKKGKAVADVPAATTATEKPTVSVPAAVTDAGAAEADDDLIMVDVKPATPQPATSAATSSSKVDPTMAPSKATAVPTASDSISAIAPAPTATPALTATSVATAATAAPSDTVQKGDDKAVPASATSAKAKPAKPKTKKKKGAAAEDQPTPSGAASSSMPMGSFPRAYSSQTLPPAPGPIDPSSVSAASAIIAAASAVSGSMPGYGLPPAPPLPYTVGQMPSSLPLIPSVASGRGGSGGSGVAGANTTPYASISTSTTTPLPAPPTSTPAPSPTAASGSDPSTYPTTASIIASAASLANAKAKESQKAAASASDGSASSITTPAPIQSATPTLAAPIAKPPPGPEDKPDLSNVELISQALRSDLCAKRGGKLTLQDVYEWIANRWIWFKRNGRHTGRDWQSSVRYAISSSRCFTRIPRRPGDPGKGIFYTMSDSKLAEQHRVNLAKQKEEAAKAASAAPTAVVSNGGAAGKSDSGSAPATPVPLTPGTVAGIAGATAAPINPTSAARAAKAAGAAGAEGTAGTAGTAGAAGASAAAGTPGSLPAIRIPLIIGTPPSSAVAATSEKPKAAPGTIESLLETPPIVHHDGKLYLSPQVFGHLNAGQLAQIEGLGAQQALQVLQAYLVTHLKERMRQQQIAAQKKDTNSAPAKASPNVTAANGKPTVATSKSVSASSPVPDASLSNVQAGIAANGTASPVKPAMPANSAGTTTAAVPVTTSLTNAPGSAVSLQSTAMLSKPVLPEPNKPSISTSSQNAVVGANAKALSTEPFATTPTPSAKSAPVADSLAAGSLGATSSSAPSIATAKTSVLPSTPLRTSVPVESAAAEIVPPISATASAPATSHSASPTKPSVTVPAVSSTTTQKVASTVKPMTPDPPASVSTAGSGASKSVSSGAAPAPAAAGTSSTLGSSSVSSTPAPVAGSGSGSTGTDSDDPLSALSALAAHPEAAALIALLRKQQENGASGGKQLARLTPGQLQLLQMANKLAAQQGKKGTSGKKKKKTGSGSGIGIGTGSGTGAREGTATPGPSGQESSPAPVGPSPSPGPKAG